MIASLPMYDWPGVAGANDRLWSRMRDALRDAGIAAPEALTRGGDLWDHWRAPDLVLSQTCGLPYRARLHGRVTLVATPDYGVEGCPPGHYCSVVVARADDSRTGLAAFAGARLAVNDPLSQSGWGAVAADAAALGLVPVGPTGGHRFSALAVAEGRADLAAIDAVTWRSVTRFEPWSARLRPVARTAPTPGLPWIAAAGADAAAMRAALIPAIAALAPEDRAALGLRGLVAIPAADYLAHPVPPEPAFAAPA
jgi:ABC-type phosphate/phosphonate transport system substrate-binding protein